VLLTWSAGTLLPLLVAPTALAASCLQLRLL